MYQQVHVWVVQHLREIKKKAKRKKKGSENTRVFSLSPAGTILDPMLSAGDYGRSGGDGEVQIAASFANAQANDANDPMQRSHL